MSVYDPEKAPLTTGDAIHPFGIVVRVFMKSFTVKP